MKAEATAEQQWKAWNIMPPQLFFEFVIQPSMCLVRIHQNYEIQIVVSVNDKLFEASTQK